MPALDNPCVYIAADFLMTKESEQFNNRRWFKDMLHRPLVISTGQSPEAFSSSLTDKSKLNRKHFFALSSIEMEDTLQFWFDPKGITQKSLDYLNQFLPKGSILIGYELGEPTRDVLKRAGVVYIDIWLHPIRFYDDILFGFSSNHKDVYDGMKPFHLTDDQFWLYADRLKIQLYKGFRRDEVDIEDNSCLIVGQTLEDKAICREGKMLNLLDFKSEIEKLAKEHSRVYFSRHPFVKSGDEEILKWLRTIPNLELTDIPSYFLISNKNLKKVVAISSSVVHEARFFGKKTEFLFKPIFTFGKRFEKDYLTIYHSFLSPHFWESALKNVRRVKENSPVTLFDEKKDKLRDMLAFYWAWPNIDKTEAMRQKLNAVAFKVHEMSKKDSQKTVLEKESSPVYKADLPSLQMGQSEKEFLAKVKKEMLKVDYVSFDVFDTVVERPFSNYETLFELIAPEVEKLTGIPSDLFIELRKKSRSLAESLRVNEEIALNLRYKAILETAGCDTLYASSLASYEYEMDRALLRPRDIGKKLYEMALSLNKKVIFVSDIYFNTEQVSSMLRDHGFRSYQKVWTSCDEGLLKHSGTLFSKVISTLNCDPKKILHIGDNEHSDVVMAKAQGINSFHLPQALATFKSRNLSAKYSKYKHAATDSLINGLISKKYYDIPESGITPSWCEGSPEKFGYSIAGPLFLGFANWVKSEAKLRGISKLYFLARDGDIVKKVYDEIAKDDPDAPSSTYLLASRRSVNIASIKSLEDALELLKINFTPCPVGEILRSRFGLESSEIKVSALVKAGYSSLEDKADFKLHQERLSILIKELWPIIEINSHQERVNLLEYYKEEGLLDAENFAIVDIGHNGTMQISIDKLTGKKPFGFYFVTYKGIKDLESKGMQALGYAGSGLSGKKEDHAYSNYLVLFEMLFLNDKGSFVKMIKENNELTPVFLPLIGEEKRVSFIKEVHENAVLFAKDVAKYSVVDLDISGPESIAPYVEMLKKPFILEAKMFEGIAFENVYSGRSVRYIINPENIENEFQSLWIEGQKIIDEYSKAKQVVINKLVDYFVLKYSSVPKQIKYKNNPKKFFKDSKKPYVRFIGKLLTRRLS